MKLPLAILQYIDTLPDDLTGSVTIHHHEGAFKIEVVSHKRFPIPGPRLDLGELSARAMAKLKLARGESE